MIPLLTPLNQAINYKRGVRYPGFVNLQYCCWLYVQNRTEIFIPKQEKREPEEGSQNGHRALTCRIIEEKCALPPLQRNGLHLCRRRSQTCKSVCVQTFQSNEKVIAVTKI